LQRRLEKRPPGPKFDKMQEESVQPQNADTPLHGDTSPAKSPEELLADAQAKLEQQREQLLRALADSDNARKRYQAEAANAQKYALERFTESLLPVLDSLEAAVKSRDPSGVELTLRQIMAAFTKSSIHQIDPAPGERFDPHRHQAMAAVEADSPPNTVVSTMQKGYSLHDRILRPALVTVAKPVEKPARNPISDTDLD
jgi:molecular chaperone GrpE